MDRVFDDPVVVWFIGRGYYGVGDYAPTKNIQAQQFNIFGKPIQRPDRYRPLSDKDALLDLILVLTQYYMEDDFIGEEDKRRPAV